MERLRKVLGEESKRRFANTAVMGGLDAFLRHFSEEARLSPEHRFSRVLRSLPAGGYGVLHPVQRQRVVEELLRAVEEKPPPDRPPVQTNRTDNPGRATKRPPPPAASRSRLVGTLDSPLSVFSGVSRTYQAKLNRLGVETVRDLLFLFPFRYHDYSQVRPIAGLRPGEEQTLLGTVWSAGEGVIGRRKGTEAIIGDDSGTLRVVWWGQTYIARRLRPGQKVALSGKVTVFRSRLQMENPEIEPLDDESIHTRRLVPVYPGTEGLPQRLVRRLAREAVDAFAEAVEEPLPASLRGKLGLPAIGEALVQIHFPDSPAAAAKARERFAFEELLYIELGVVRRRREWQASGTAPRLALGEPELEGFADSLPFALTAAQRRAISDLLTDIARDLPMSRLLEGDVGSGKTVVAAVALLAAVASGYQGAIMAPTEILAEQHFRTLVGLLEPGARDGNDAGPWFDETVPGVSTVQPAWLARPVRIALLTGSLRAADKGAAQEAIAAGDADIIIGTHALVQRDVRFDRLGLAVVDEQHRFGVVQRAALREKGSSPHLLVMTATPIPRTLALTVYGDLDVSVLDEMPPGRPVVKTHRVHPSQRQRAYDFVQKKVGEGRQAYIICPLVEESEAVAAKAAVQEYERLSREVFPDLRLGLLHGRVTPAEKEAAMRAFRDGELDILVSTAVVEVGIDVPNATVMLVEGAERFGLAQLHQFRGRVRRSGEQAYCLLLSDSPSPEAQERLQIMEKVHDGFRLAEEDLRLRGPGEYFGTRQSGMPDLKVAKLTDIGLIEKARREATRLLEDDPELRRPEHTALRSRMEELWGRISAEVS